MKAVGAVGQGSRALLTGQKIFGPLCQPIRPSKNSKLNLQVRPSKHQYCEPRSPTRLSFRTILRTFLFLPPSFSRPYRSVTGFKIIFTMASGEKMDIEQAEQQLKQMAHSEQHYFNR